MINLQLAIIGGLLDEIIIRITEKKMLSKSLDIVYVSFVDFISIHPT